MMVMISLFFSWPVISIFSSYDALSWSTQSYMSTYIGNMGGADTTCNQVPFGILDASIMLSCTAGGLNTEAKEFGDPNSNAFSAGIINAS
jgi:hypothetical protein